MLFRSRQILSLIEESLATFNNANISNSSLTYIQNKLNEVSKSELYNETFQLITSTNILEEQVKNYLLENNSLLADYSLQQILNTINQPIYSDYITFQDIKEIVNKSTSNNSFAILTEIKQYINNVNSEENAQFINELKTFISESDVTSTYSESSFTEELRNFISTQNSYSQESFNQIINSVTNRFQNKSALELNNIIKENINQLNQVVETLYSSVANNYSKETILNTLSTFSSNKIGRAHV